MRLFFTTSILAVFIPMMVFAQGAVATTAEVERTPSSSGVEARLKGIVWSLYNDIDPWRQKQALYFSELRDKKREELGIKTTRDMYEVLVPDAPEAPALPGQDNESLSDLSTQYQGVNIGAYFTLLYATALATIFASIALFYITLVLLLLLVLRLIFRILFR